MRPSSDGVTRRRAWKRGAQFAIRTLAHQAFVSSLSFTTRSQVWQTRKVGDSAAQRDSTSARIDSLYALGGLRGQFYTDFHCSTAHAFLQSARRRKPQARQAKEEAIAASWKNS
jgi:hypothetical protein